MAIEDAPKTETSPAVVADAQDIARKIWLAGVGAYGRAFDAAQDQFEKVAGSASDVFDHLVARGEQLEDQVRDRLAHNEAATKVGQMVEKVQAFSVERQAVLEKRVETVRKLIADSLAPVAALNPLGKKHASTEELLARIEALTEEVAELKAAKAPRAKKATDSAE
jgi:ABC-type transporter Mla subunit MlaD